MPITQQRVGEFLREGLSYLAQHESRTRQEVVDHLETAMQPSPDESEPDKNDRPWWQTRFLWTSVGMVKAGWMTKDGSGVWAVTPAGRQALDQYPDPESFRLAAHHAYREWEKSSKPAQRRAWLVRGSSVLGVNVVPEWLAEGFCSLAASQLRAPRAAVTAAELEEMAKADYAHLKHHELKAKVEEIVAFVAKFNVGDVILTTSESHVFLGDVTGDWSYVDSDGGRSNLRRPVDWRNADAPVDFAGLPDPLPARLQSGSTVLDLTADLALIDALVEPDAGDPEAESTVRSARHERLPEPTEALATELFVDRPWLREVGDLLNERRQVIFYGPPGTGKTYIARKLAADLVGPEQVKLVQFHPAYTYEDFFEGYRPAPGSAEGTISFELKAGPLRQLVNRAREHPDQAFVLIIDEINRANLAKVFGELYFLLEYRDQAVDLLYSADDEGFTLPKNLYLIGTMNTADRSIALIDAAMRRRFAFVELTPDAEPTKSLLAKWSAHQGLGDTAARLLDRLNQRIEDPDFRIGPSYFMKSTEAAAHSHERLDRIWRTSILPLLQEHHYGEWESVRRHYRLDALMSAIAPADQEIADESVQAVAEADDGVLTDLYLHEGGESFVGPLDDVVGEALAASGAVTAIRVGGGEWEVGPSTKVGVVTIGDVTVWIRPKVHISRVMFLLGYAKNPGWRADQVALAEVDDLVPVLAQAFADQADRAIETGLLQGYTEVDDSLTVLRGRLREQDQLRQRFGIALPLLVRYDDHTVDIPENQLLRGATELLLRVPGVHTMVRSRLRRLRGVLADVSAPVQGGPLPVWRPNRLNERYHVALWLAEVLLRRNAIDQAPGAVRLGGFLVDMAKVYEDFLTAALTESLEQHGGWARPQDRHHLDVDEAIAMRPDLVWYRDAAPAAVIDAKYKAEKPAGFPDADLYQMLAYCTALQLDDGHLVYAKGNAEEVAHTVRHADIKIHAHTLDLSQPPVDLLAQVDALAYRIASRCQVAPCS